jgi:ribosome-binding protein aMBF1 (putative translation factor)
MAWRRSCILDAIASAIQTDEMAKDFVAEIVDERTARNPKFPDLVDESEERRKLARKLAATRERKALSQTVVAARMGTSASVVSKLEAGGDVKVSTLQRYCAAIGKRFAVAS